MAILLNCATHQRIYLRTEHLFGRSGMAHTVLGEAGASLLHASIRWSGMAWELRDHSRNGTLIDDRPVPPNQPVGLNLGAVIKFCDPSAWLVEDLARPSSVLWPLAEEDPVISLSDVNLLPGDTAGEISIYVAPSGDWFCERSAETRLLRDGDEVRMGGKGWFFISGGALQETLELRPGAGGDAAVTLMHFDVSLDEEHVSLQIARAGHVIKLGERTHHYCLLTLARRRIADAHRGIDRDAQGWVYLETLARMLGVDATHVNIQIFRARKQIAHALPPAPVMPEIVERRRGEIRFGNWAVRIMRGSLLEDTLEPPAPTSPE